MEKKRKNQLMSGNVPPVAIFTTAIISLAGMCVLCVVRKRQALRGLKRLPCKRIKKCGGRKMDIDLYIYECEICGQRVVSLVPLENPITCCNHEMECLEPGSVDASTEKHIPQFEIYGDTIGVNIGSTPHPMNDEHHIEWVAAVTDRGLHMKFLDPKGYPKTSFKIGCHENLKAIYEYCNLHGLWKNEG